MPVDDNNDTKTMLTNSKNMNNLSTTTTNFIQKSDHSSSLTATTTTTLFNNGSKRIDDKDKNENSIPLKDSSSSSSSATTIVAKSSNDDMIKYFLKVKDFNDVITCFLCKGYLIDATTINECLHSFCKTCILRYFDDDNNPKSRSCPKCDTQVHKTKPKLNIRSDPTRQDIVYKLVPGLYKSEMNRRKEFYRRFPDKATGLSNEEKGEINGERLILSNDDQIQITIEYFPEVSNPFPLLPFNNDENSNVKLTNLNQRRYLLVKSGMRVLHLKKFIQYKYELDPSIQVDFFYKHERLKDDYTIMDVAYIYSWRRNIPIPLYYLILEPNKTHDDYIWLNNNEPKLTPLSIGRQQSLRQTRLQMRRMSDLNNSPLNANRRRMRSNSSGDLLVSSSYKSNTKPIENSLNQNNRTNSTAKFSPKAASTPLSMKSTSNLKLSKSNVSISSTCTTSNSSSLSSSLITPEKSFTDKKDSMVITNKRSLTENGSTNECHSSATDKKLKSEFNNHTSIVNSEQITAITKISNPIVIDQESNTVTNKETKIEEIIKQQSEPQLQQQQIASVTIPLCSNVQNSSTSSSSSSSSTITVKIDENHRFCLSIGNDTKPKLQDFPSSSSSTSSSSNSSRSSSPMTLLNKIIKKVEEQTNNGSCLSLKSDSPIEATIDNTENKPSETVIEENSDQLPSLVSANSIVAIDSKSNQNSNQTSSSNGDGLVFSTLITLNNPQDSNSSSNGSLKIDKILDSLASIVEADEINERNASSSPSNNTVHINGVDTKNGIMDSKSDTVTTANSLNDKTPCSNDKNLLSNFSNTSDNNDIASLSDSKPMTTTTTTHLSLINTVLNGSNSCDSGSNGGSMNDFQEFQKLLYEQINKATSASNPSTKSMDTINNSNGTKNHHSLESSSSSV